MPCGAVSLRYDYRLNGRRETVVIGRYDASLSARKPRKPDELGLGMAISLSEARILRDQAARAIQRGESPSRAKVEKRVDAAEALTFGKWAGKYFEEARCFSRARLPMRPSPVQSLTMYRSCGYECCGVCLRSRHCAVTEKSWFSRFGARGRSCFEFVVAFVAQSQFSAQPLDPVHADLHATFSRSCCSHSGPKRSRVRLWAASSSASRRGPCCVLSDASRLRHP